jgi:hypothetical protein
MFAPCRQSCRDYADTFLPLCVNHRDEPSCGTGGELKTRLTIVHACVNILDAKEIAESLRSNVKMDAMLAEICFGLGIIPFKVIFIEPSIRDTRS